MKNEVQVVELGGAKPAPRCKEGAMVNGGKVVLCFIVTIKAGSTVYEYLTQAEGHENESRDNECSRQLDKKKREMPMSQRHPAVRHPGAMPGIRVA